MRHLTALSLFVLSACAIDLRDADKQQDTGENPDTDITDTGFDDTGVDDTGEDTGGSGSTTANNGGFHRLTREQFLNTYVDLMTPYYQDMDFDYYGLDPDYETVPNAMQNMEWSLQIVSGYPHDTITGEPGQVRGGFTRFDKVVYSLHVDLWTSWAMATTTQFFAWEPGFRVPWESCRLDYESGQSSYNTVLEAMDDCIPDFLVEFAERAWRHPLSPDDIDFVHSIYNESKTAYLGPLDMGENELSIGSCWQNPDCITGYRGLRDGIAVIMSSPEFLYHIEKGDGTNPLSAYELASRLSYHFWNTMPDEELFEAASDGSLLTDEGYRDQVERLFLDDKARNGLREFFSDYFRVEEIPEIGEALGNEHYYEYFPFTYDDYGEPQDHQESIQEELTDLGLWHSHTAPDTFEELFSSNLNFSRSNFVTEFSYGMNNADIWDGESMPVENPDPQRAGLLTRMGLLAADSVNARPVHKGIYIREALLCEELLPPISCDVVVVPQIDPSMNTRETIEAINEVPGTQCYGCHKTNINPFGHGTGHFNAMGQYMDVEPIFDPDTWEFNYSPIDASASARMESASELVEFDGAHELRDILLNSAELETCFARTYFRHALRRVEKNSEETLIENFGEQLHDGLSIDEFMIEFAMSDAFRTRLWPWEEEEDVDPGDPDDPDDPDDDPDDEAPDLSTADLANGENLYYVTCSGCHGLTGTEGFAPNLVIGVPNLTNNELYLILRDGLPGMNSPIAGTQNIADVMAYLRSWEN